MPRVRRRSMKGTLNKLIDTLVHDNKPVEDLGTLIVDEALHTLVDGEFRLDKFLRYHVLPRTRRKRRRRRR